MAPFISHLASGEHRWKLKSGFAGQRFLPNRIGDRLPQHLILSFYWFYWSVAVWIDHTIATPSACFAQLARSP